MTRKQRRLTMIGGALAVLAVALALVLSALRDSIVFPGTRVAPGAILIGAIAGHFGIAASLRPR